MDKKLALITGGTKGIGAGISKMLLHHGYDIIVTYCNDVANADAFVAQARLDFPSSEITAIRIDNSDYSQVAKLVQYISEKKAIHCIVCNAGITLRKSLTEISNDDWLRVMNANVNNNLFMIRDLYPFIPNDSRIVFIGSMMAVRPHGTSLAYGVSKSAVHALALNLVKVFEGTGTTVNVIAPGFVETDWQKSKPEEIRQNIYRKTAIKRFATVEEIADAVKFCVYNPFVNGSVIEVSGGYDFK